MRIERCGIDVVASFIDVQKFLGDILGGKRVKLCSSIGLKKTDVMVTAEEDEDHAAGGREEK